MQPQKEAGDNDGHAQQGPQVHYGLHTLSSKVRPTILADGTPIAGHKRPNPALKLGARIRCRAPNRLCPRKRPPARKVAWKMGSVPI
ncbi:hypothetical protein GCM10011572_09360 [Pseudoduganella buxea]|uniref:Uncharacterized protein n=1 Tax=Pseudoduganella buxea TaxID=1949069 RepID=A0ABQ1K9D1_9BURK|nr:hypothetical protein GCM10011572_09360 [Pseudoduganella buxea]